MLREGFDVARCTVKRLMAELGLQGVVRGKPFRTTVQDKAAPCPLDHVNRVFHAPAPNQLWLSDFTIVSTWSGFVYVAFIIDGYARGSTLDQPCGLAINGRRGRRSIVDDYGC
jgi:putative transposase